MNAAVKPSTVPRACVSGACPNADRGEIKRPNTGHIEGVTI